MDNTNELSFKVRITFSDGTGISLLCESYSIDTERCELTLYDAGGNILGWFSDVAWFYAGEVL